MNHHDTHAHCQHDTLKYCRPCNVVYCRACSQEWRQHPLWTYTYPYTYTSTVLPVTTWSNK